MKIARSPTVWLVPGPVPPMLWAVGTPRLFLPAGLVSRLEEPGRRRCSSTNWPTWRRDHWVRWLELLVAGLYWWYPVVWLARRRLQAAEEECCDAWVVSELPGYGAAYAGALLETVDFLSREPAPLPPAASGFGRVHHLKRRLTMIVRGSTPPRPVAGWAGSPWSLLALTLPLVPGRSAAPPRRRRSDGRAGRRTKKPEPEAKKPAAPPRSRCRATRRRTTAPPACWPATAGRCGACRCRRTARRWPSSPAAPDDRGRLTLFDLADGQGAGQPRRRRSRSAASPSRPTASTWPPATSTTRSSSATRSTGEVQQDARRAHRVGQRRRVHRRLEARSSRASLDKTLKVWDVATGKEHQDARPATPTGC